MTVFLPPSKTKVSERDIERFNHLYRKLHTRLAPGTPEEHSLCNEIIVALWHFRSFRARAQSLERQLRLSRLEDLPPSDIAVRQGEIEAAWRQSRQQKNFAWRRRGKFFDMKTLREQAEKLARDA